MKWSWIITWRLLPFSMFVLPYQVVYNLSKMSLTEQLWYNQFERFSHYTRVRLGGGFVRTQRTPWIRHCFNILSIPKPNTVDEPKKSLADNVGWSATELRQQGHTDSKDFELVWNLGADTLNMSSKKLFLQSFELLASCIVRNVKFQDFHLISTQTLLPRGQTTLYLWKQTWSAIKGCYIWLDSLDLLQQLLGKQPFQ